MSSRLRPIHERRRFGRFAWVRRVARLDVAEDRSLIVALRRESEKFISALGEADITACKLAPPTPMRRVRNFERVYGARAKALTLLPSSMLPNSALMMPGNVLSLSRERGIETLRDTHGRTSLDGDATATAATRLRSRRR